MKKITKKDFVILLVSFFTMAEFFIGYNAKAAEYFVAVDGSDSNNGLIDSPYKTLEPAITVVNPGDTIYLRGGTYGLENAMVSGASRNPLIPRSDNKQSCPAGQTSAEGSDGWYCFFNTYSIIPIQDFSGWASDHTGYSVNSGLPDAPITVKAYQEEKVYFTAPSSDGMPANIYSCPLTTTDGCAASTISNFVRVGSKSHWIVEGFNMDASYITGMGAIHIWGGNSDPGPTHDIMIRNNEIHNYIAWAGSGNNVGLIKIDRGDLGGPYNIFIHNNKLHDMSDPNNPGVWSGITDKAHYGAIATLSRQSYLGFEGGGTGYIEIIGNTLYNLPSVFFFKNISAGPLKITDNIIHDANILGSANTSNMSFIHNMVYNVSGNFNAGYVGDNIDITADQRFFEIDGQNAIVKYNTFVGLNSLFSVGTGTGHQINNNIFFGMSGRTPGANWDTTAYIAKSSNYNDTLDPVQSILGQIQSDNNCFITPYADFQMVSRYLRPEVTGTDKWQVDHFDKNQALSLYGYDPNSVFITESDPAVIFANPEVNNYQLLDANTCPKMGYFAYKAIYLVASPVEIIKNKAPQLSFSTDNSGTITYSGACSSAATSAVAGENMITLSSLNIGTYSNCSITVTDTNGNASAPLQIPEFTITYPSDNDLDKDVDIFDYNILLGEFGKTNVCQNQADTNEDCEINIFDYNNLLGDFGKNF